MSVFLSHQGVPAAADLDLIVALQGESLPVSQAPSSNTDPDVCIARDPTH